MSDGLKPCPFCGVGVGALSRYHPRDPNEWYVSCAAKDCVMQPETPTYRTEAEALAAWNRRASDAEIERLRAAIDWRPIESAPKDGTAVLLYRSNARRTVKVDRWLAGWWYETKIEHAPTHWLPLPEPPKEPKQ